MRDLLEQPIVDDDFALGRCGCLLYTSDAADERSSVDLGGRRIIKKKTNTNIPDRSTFLSIKRTNQDTTQSSEAKREIKKSTHRLE